VSDEAIDRALDRLDDALRAAGLEPLAPALDPGSVDAVDRELAPYALPPELKRCWERVDLWKLKAHGSCLGPSPADARSALEIYRMNLEPGVRLLYGPPLLFPIAADHVYQASIELVSEWGPGGSVFSQGDELRFEYASLTDVLDVYAELVEEGLFERSGDFASLSYEAEIARRERRLRTSLRGDGYDPRAVREDPVTWPAHWLASAGLDIRDREPRGPTHTIAALLEAAAGGPVRARIAGTVVRAVGSGEGVRVVVDDGTGTIDVWCAAGTTPWGIQHRGRFEFEVAVESALGSPLDVDTGHDEVQRHALAGRIDEASAAATAFFGRIESHPPAAVARTVRPLG